MTGATAAAGAFGPVAPFALAAKYGGSLLGKARDVLMPSLPNLPSKSLTPPPPLLRRGEPDVSFESTSQKKKAAAAAKGLSAFTVPLLGAPA